MYVCMDRLDTDTNVQRCTKLEEREREGERERRNYPRGLEPAENNNPGRGTTSVCVCQGKLA